MKRPFLKRKPIILTPKELVDELSRREGVKEVVFTPYDQYSVATYNWDKPHSIMRYGGTGSARILAVIDRLKRCGNCARRESRLYCRELTPWQRFIARLFGCYMWWMK